MLATDVTRNSVWQEMLDTARLARYYYGMTRIQRRRHHCVRLLLLLSAIAGIAALIDILPDEIRVLTVAAIAGVVVVDFLAGFANKAALLGLICAECSEVSDELAGLWADLQAGSIGDDEARRTLKDLKRRVTRATNRVTNVDIPTNERLNARCEEIAFRTMADRYAKG